MSADREMGTEGFFTGAYDFTRTEIPTQTESAMRAVCFCDAVKTGDSEIVDTLLQEGFDINETWDFSDAGFYFRPLTTAILNGDINMTKHLIERGAEVGNVPSEGTTYGARSIADAMQLEPTRAIATVLGLQAIREGFKDVLRELQNAYELGGLDSMTVFSLSKSPLEAACYMKSIETVKSLLEAGAEFGDCFYGSIDAILNNDRPCTEDERKRLLDLAFASRDRIGFDRFVNAVDDFEQYVNGEWRRSLAMDSYNPDVVMQEKAWQTCDRLLTNPVYRKRLPVSQLLYAKYCELQLTDIIVSIAAVSKVLDSAESLEDLEFTLLELNQRKFCSPSLFPVQFGLLPDPRTGKKVVAAIPKMRNTDKATEIANRLEILETVVLPQLQELDVEIDLDDYGNMVKEIEIVGDQATLQVAFCAALDGTHTMEEYAELYGESIFFAEAGCSFMKPEITMGECPIHYDEAAIKKAVGCFTQDTLSRVKNYMKCSYAYSLADLITAKATEQEPGKRFATFESVCGDLVSDELSPAYLDVVLDEETIENLNDLLKNIKQAYRLAIQASSHISDDSRDRALCKLDNIDLVIVGANRIARTVEGAPIIDDWDFLDNANRFWHLREEKELIDFLSGNDDASSTIAGYTWTYNAAYSLMTNSVHLYGAFLQPPTYSAKRSSVMNYAALGSTIGHEISHAFDPNSIAHLIALGSDDSAVDIFSSSPTYAENIVKLKNQFKNKVPRRLAQASPLLTLGNDFDGEKCTGENFADIVGLEVALLAYALSCGCETIADLVAQKPDDVKLFMQSYALRWREKPSTERLKRQMENDVHAPSEFRANTVKNLDAFHEVFGTKEGDGMWLDPSERVSVFGIH